MSQFKVIIAGGGPVGLTTALALSRANIRFILLEKYESAIPTQGSDLVLNPYGIRALSQLGLLEDLLSISTPLGDLKRIDYLGNSLGEVDMFHKMKENFGQSARVLKRYDLCKIMYNALSSYHDTIICHKNICTISETPCGVTVVCTDGSSYTADLIIGADGVHSVVRAYMSRNTPTQTSSHEPCKEKGGPMKTSSRCLWMRLDKMDSLTVGDSLETHAPGASTQVFVSEDHVICALYERLPQPIYQRVRYLEEDEEEMVRRWNALPILADGSMTVGDLYARKTSSGLTPVQEGVRDQWSFGARMVLAGDAAHVFSPITGSGCNNGIADVVVLTNELRRLLDTAATPSSEAMIKALASYQEARQHTVRAQCLLGSRVASLSSWDGIFYRLLDQYVMTLPWVQQRGMRRGMDVIAKAPCFEFLPADRKFRGKTPWQKSGKGQ